MIKMLRPEDVCQPKLGAPRGNRNAIKTGAHIGELRMMRKKVAAACRRMSALMAAAEVVLRERKV